MFGVKSTILLIVIYLSHFFFSPAFSCLLLDSFFILLLSGSFPGIVEFNLTHVHMNVHATIWVDTSVAPSSCFCVASFCPLSCPANFRHAAFSQLQTVSSTQGDLPLFVFWLTAFGPRNCPQVMNWGNCRIYFNFPLLSRTPDIHPLFFTVWKHLFSIFFLVFPVVYSKWQFP